MVWLKQLSINNYSFALFLFNILCKLGVCIVTVVKYFINSIIETRLQFKTDWCVQFKMPWQESDCFVVVGSMNT